MRGGLVRSERKLCSVVQNSLARGPAARPRCIPPASGSSWALNPIQSHRSYRRSTTRGRLRSPCTHRSFQEDQGLSRPLEPLTGLGDVPLHPAPQPCTNGCPFDHQSGERSCSHRYPHEDFIQTISWRPTFRSLEARHVIEAGFTRDQEGSASPLPLP